MIRTLIVPVVAGLLLSTLPVSSGQAATRTGTEILKPISRIYAEVQARKDYGSLGRVTYDRRDRVFHFVYKAKDGTEKHVVIDAVTGKQIL